MTFNLSPLCFVFGHNAEVDIYFNNIRSLDDDEVSDFLAKTEGDRLKMY